MSKLTIRQRINIVMLWKETRNVRETARRFNGDNPSRLRPLSSSTVSKIIEKFNVTGSVADKNRSGRPKSAINNQNIAQVTSIVDEDEHVSTRKISRQIDISQSSVVRILKKEKFFPYKMGCTFKIYEEDYARRLHFCQEMSQKLNNDPTIMNKILWSDESLFFLNGTPNHQNYRYWSKSNPHWVTESKYINAPKVMIWAGIINSQIIGPYFFPANVNSESYLQMLGDWLLPELQSNNINPLEIYLQQDGAAAHNARIVKEWIMENFYDYIGTHATIKWPARSPDLTPCDFFLWGYIKDIVYRKNSRNLNELKENITLAFQSLTREMLSKVEQEIKKRWDICIIANGGHADRL